MLDAIFDILFSYPDDVTFLEFVDLKRVDRFLKVKCPLHIGRLTLQSSMDVPPMTPDHVKATIIIAKRCHRDGDHLKAGLLYLQLTCRRARNDENVPLEERCALLDNQVQTLVRESRVRWVHASDDRVQCSFSILALYRR